MRDGDNTEKERTVNVHARGVLLAAPGRSRGRAGGNAIRRRSGDRPAADAPDLDLLTDDQFSMTRHIVWRAVNRGLAPNPEAAHAIIRDVIVNGRRVDNRLHYGGMIVVLEENRAVTIYANERRRKVKAERKAKARAAKRGRRIPAARCSHDTPAVMH